MWMCMQVCVLTCVNRFTKLISCQFVTLQILSKRNSLCPACVKILCFATFCNYQPVFRVNLLHVCGSWHIDESFLWSIVLHLRINQGTLRPGKKGFKTRVSGFKNSKPGFGFDFTCIKSSAYCLVASNSL